MPVATEPLHHEVVDLGLGLAAEVTITEIDPEDAPRSGAEWPVETDWPRAQLTIALPATNPYLSAALISDVKVLGEVLREAWGTTGSMARSIMARCKSINWRRPTLAESVDYLRVIAAGDLAQLRAHVARRAERLAQRERTLEAGRRGPELASAESVDRPIELDTAPLAVAPVAADPADDDSSQRFALLEIDPVEQTQTAATAPRNRRRKAA